MVRESGQLRKDEPLCRPSAIVAQQEGTSPEEGAEHQENPDIVREVREPMVPLQEIQHRQDVVPVVAVGFFSGHAADEHEVERARIVDVRGDVHHAFCCPPQGHCRAERITGLDQECAETDHRHKNLAERASQNRHETTEWNEDDMSRFVKGQIDQVQKGLTGVIGFKRRGDECPPPPDHGNEHNRPSVKCHCFGGDVGLDQPLLGCPQPPRAHTRQ